MKMGGIGGIVLILIGVSIIVPGGIPIFRIGIAVLLLFIGIKILMGGSFGSCNFEDMKKNVGDNTVLFASRDIKYSDKNSEYNIIFGSSEIDLRNIELENSERFELNVVLGEGVLLIDKDMPIKIELTSVFAGVELPNGENTSFGEKTYETSEYEEADAKLKIKINVIMGSLKIKE